MSGIYIHIPFCKSRCIYCGFYSTTGREFLMDRYIRSVVKELLLRRDYINIVDRARTLYIGGGTPSLLTPLQLKTMKEGLVGVESHLFDSLEEFTVECNPDDVTPDYSSALKDIGVTRVSMGVQSFSDARLRFLRRRHKSHDIAFAVETLKQSGIDNISIDLMFSFPGETIEEWEQDIARAISLGVEHISAYSLMYEEGTPLYGMLEENKVYPVDEEVSREMFEVLTDMLEEAGYEHYEISNFAKKGYRSRHNSSYWSDVAYIGLGASSHSYNGKTRQWNCSNIEEYIAAIESGRVPCELEEIDAKTHYNDTVTTALRTREGIDLSLVQEPFLGYLVCNAEKAIKCGNLVREGHFLHLTRKGVYISDDVMSDLVWV